ncbi:hypothetical protein M8J76_014791 [Diaphorina citri]|nr:hypothetical protein M8J76_014791 [Diaphorina citri]
MIIIIHHLIGNRKDTLERQRRMMRVNRENRITLKNHTTYIHRYGVMRRLNPISYHCDWEPSYAAEDQETRPAQ